MMPSNEEVKNLSKKLRSFSTASSLLDLVLQSFSKFGEVFFFFLQSFFFWGGKENLLVCPYPTSG